MVITKAILIEIVNVKAISDKNELWVLAKKVAQCFYIIDTTKSSHHVMRRGKKSIIEIDGVIDKNDFDQFDDPDMEQQNDDANQWPSGRSRTTCTIAHPFKRHSHSKGLTYTRKKTKTTD